jgi:hypothetical protein
MGSFSLLGFKQRTNQGLHLEQREKVVLQIKNHENTRSLVVKMICEFFFFFLFLLGHGLEQSLERVVETGSNCSRPGFHGDKSAITTIEHLAGFVSFLHILEHSR